MNPVGKRQLKTRYTSGDPVYLAGYKAGYAVGRSNGLWQRRHRVAVLEDEIRLWRQVASELRAVLHHYGIGPCRLAGTSKPPFRCAETQ